MLGIRVHCSSFLLRCNHHRGRAMRAYGKEPDNQMELELPGLTGSGYELMQEARGWVNSHIREWSWYKQFALGECSNGKASPNFCLQSMRRHFKCEIPNAYAPALARIAMEEDSRLEFRLAKSKVDGFTKARL